MFNAIASAARLAASNFLALGKMGLGELLLVLIIVVVIFGPKQLPKLAQTFGKTITSFKKGIEDGLEEEKKPEAAEETKKDEQA